MAEPEGVLLTGIFGSGKTSVAVEMAETLEARDQRYAALDLDWLWWFYTDMERSEARRVLTANLSAVVANYLETGSERFVLAWAMRDSGDLAAVRSVLPFRVRVAEIVTPIELIAERLSPDATEERARNLATARRWHDERIGIGLGEATFDNSGPLQAVAAAVIGWLGWD